MRDLQERLRDEVLVLRCQEGDAKALDELVQRWYPRLLRYARCHVGAPEVAADLTQEAWMAIIQGIHRVADPNAFPAWACRILANKCRDWIRRRHCERGILAKSTQAAVESVPWRNPGARPETDAVEKALSTLDAADRAMVTLYYFEDLTVAEIAAILNIPAGTVKSRLYRCRLALRKHLEESHHE